MNLYIMLPTYNEAENIIPLCRALLDLSIESVPQDEIHILVVDDNSPDGTAGLAEEFGRDEPRVHVLLRKKKRGRGLAGAEGFRWCLDRGADLVLEMDADFSHHPRHIPAMVRAAETADVVLGSRFTPGGKDVDRSFLRQIITKLAGMYIRGMLGLGVRDVSSGFRLFRRAALEKIDPEELIAVGPPIVTEVLYRAHCAGCRIAESPIQFEDRQAGVTKLDYITLLESLVMVLRLKQMNKAGRIARG